MKRVKQIEDSKERIAQGFINLLKDNKFEEINITKITQKAEVTRMTFYRHFKNKDDVIQYILSTIQNEVSEKISSIDNPSLVDLIRLRFKVLSELPWIKALHDDKSITQIINDFKLQNVDYFKELLPNYKDKDLQLFCVGGVDYLTVKWIENGMKESYEEMTDKIILILKRIYLTDKS